ncbi:unnamed protein product [Symbiodinium natans]|uniref:Uncharacterized protein n=1 Tax=Symbiodinium natans TaxID=878477 RepID=A0A812RPW4_9DINO|nr:unnamed protein product [Symbiodinium natans]
MPDPTSVAWGLCEASADLTHEVLVASPAFTDEDPSQTRASATAGEIQSGNSEKNVVMSVDLDQPVVLLTFARRNGESEVLKFRSRPLFFRIARSHPYTVTDIAEGLGNSTLQAGWVLTHVNGEKMSVHWHQASLLLRTAIQGLPQTSRSDLKEPAPSKVNQKSGRSASSTKRSNQAAIFMAWVPAGSVEHSIMRYQSSLLQTMRAA